MKRIILTSIGTLLLLIFFRLYLGYCVVLQCKFIEGTIYRPINAVDNILSVYNIYFLPAFSRNLFATNDNKIVNNGYVYGNWGKLESVDLNSGEITLTDVYGDMYSVFIPELLISDTNSKSANVQYWVDNVVVDVSREDLYKIGKGKMVMIYWMDSRSLTKLVIDRLLDGTRSYVLPKDMLISILLNNRKG